jgi:hypothetical protein
VQASGPNDGGGGGRGGGGSSGGRGASGGPGSGGIGNISMHGVPMEPILIMIRKLFKNNEKALVNCAFLVDLFGFQRCILSLMKTFDMRQFFGGMAAYHDSQRMATVLGVKTDFKFVNDFADGKNGQVIIAILSKSSKMAHFVFKCNKEDYLSLLYCHLGWRTLVLKCNKNNYD